MASNAERDKNTRCIFCVDLSAPWTELRPRKNERKNKKMERSSHWICDEAALRAIGRRGRKDTCTRPSCYWSNTSLTSAYVGRQKRWGKRAVQFLRPWYCCWSNTLLKSAQSSEREAEKKNTREAKSRPRFYWSNTSLTSVLEQQKRPGKRVDTNSRPWWVLIERSIENRLPVEQRESPISKRKRCKVKITSVYRMITRVVWLSRRALDPVTAETWGRWTKVYTGTENTLVDGRVGWAEARKMWWIARYVSYVHTSMMTIRFSPSDGKKKNGNTKCVWLQDVHFIPVVCGWRGFWCWWCGGGVFRRCWRLVLIEYGWVAAGGLVLWGAFSYPGYHTKGKALYLYNIIPSQRAIVVKNPLPPRISTKRNNFQWLLFAFSTHAPPDTNVYFLFFYFLFQGILL